jgi:Ca2+-binding EF-hand superfamily protein
MVLSQEEFDGCRRAFLSVDKERSGTIDVWELRQVLEALGQKPTKDKLFHIVSEFDKTMSGNLDFAEFLKIIEYQQEDAEIRDDEGDMIAAFGMIIYSLMYSFICKYLHMIMCIY